MILSVTLNPSIDQTLFVEGLKPHDTNRIVRSETDAGGKGVNLSRVVVELGGVSVATGFLGGGPGAYVRRVLDAQEVAHDFIEVQGNTRTNIAVEDGSGQAPTAFSFKGPSVSEDEWHLMVHKVAGWAPKSSWVTLGGSLPTGVPVEAYLMLGQLAKEKGARLALDADGEAMRRGIEARPHFIKPNGKEAGRLLGRSVEKIEDAIFAAEELRQYLEPDGVCVVSLGVAGAVMSSPAGTLIGRPVAVEAQSTIGSGDSLVGAMLTVLDKGRSIEEAFKLGIAAGTATAMTSGAEIARKPVVDEVLTRVQVEAAN
ncbi:MAG: 1-phosphofructokinase family hexose kinase [Fimbriimonadaceae bacterium]